MMKILFIILVATMGFGATFVTIINSPTLTKTVIENSSFLENFMENTYE